jgi:hypothetical protein
MDRPPPAGAGRAGVPLLAQGYGVGMAAEDRLEKVQQEIDQARKEAQDAGILDDPEERRFYETGELSDMDDQTIAPPG